MSVKKLLALLLFAVMLLTFTGCDSQDYKSALSLMENQQWTEARELFVSLGDYKDSAAMLTECDYNIALDSMQDGDYDKASEQFDVLGDYKDSADLFTECSYLNAVELYEAGEYEKAYTIFDSLDGYKDSDRRSVISLLLADQNRFVDDFVVDMKSEYILEDIPYTLYDRSSANYDERSFTVTGKGSSGLTSVYFSNITEDWNYYRNGQINGVLIMGTASATEEISSVYQEFISTSAITLHVLDSSSDTKELAIMVNEKTTRLLASGFAPITEYVNGVFCEFEYEGYNCFLGISDLGGDCVRYTFSVAVPELVT